MSKHKQTEKLYSLKDQLFNEVKVKQLAGEIKAVYPAFDFANFTRVTLAGFPDQELMQRLTAISDNLHTCLPANYKEAVAIILKSLPPVLDEEKEDAFGLEITTFETVEKKLVRFPKKKKAEISRIEEAVRMQLGGDKTLNIAALANLLKDLLKK